MLRTFVGRAKCGNCNATKIILMNYFCVNKYLFYSTSFLSWAMPQSVFGSVPTKRLEVAVCFITHFSKWVIVNYCGWKSRWRIALRKYFIIQPRLSGVPYKPVSEVWTVFECPCDVQSRLKTKFEIWFVKFQITVESLT